MRDDFDAVVTDRFKVLDQVPVPDTWSRVQFKVLDHVPDADMWSPVQFTEAEAVSLVDVKTTDPTENRNEGRRRVLLAGILAAASVLAIAFVATRDADDVTPVDEPSTTVTVPPPPPQALFGTLMCSSRPGRTSSTRSTEHRRHGSSLPSAPGGRATAGASTRATAANG